MEAKGNPYMEVAKDEMEKINQSKMERYLYLRREMAFSDHISQMRSATNQGIQKGELLKLITQVRKKYDKGISPAEIAEVLEEDAETIQSIYQAIENNPDKTTEDLAEILNQNNDFYYEYY